MKKLTGLLCVSTLLLFHSAFAENAFSYEYLYVNIYNSSPQMAHLLGNLEKNGGIITQQGAAAIPPFQNTQWIMKQNYVGPSGVMTYFFGKKTCAISYKKSRSIFLISAGENQTTITGSCTLHTLQPSRFFGKEPAISSIVLRDDL